MAVDSVSAPDSRHASSRLSAQGWELLKLFVAAASALAGIVEQLTVQRETPKTFESSRPAQRKALRLQDIRWTRGLR
jgi:hypothetical protein